MYVHYGHAGAIYLRGVAGTKKVGGKNTEKILFLVLYI